MYGKQGGILCTIVYKGYKNVIFVTKCTETCYDKINFLGLQVWGVFYIWATLNFYSKIIIKYQIFVFHHDLFQATLSLALEE